MSLEKEATRIVARQPILDDKERVYGYELLFRGGVDNFFSATDGDAATRDVVENLFTSGTGVLTAGHRAFINCTRQFLINDYATLLPKEQAAIEVLENIEADDDVVSALRRLKQAGYLIVLDDFVLSEKVQPFIELADIIKVDFLATPSSARRALVSRFSAHGIRFLAEKVESREEFEEAVAAGYRYFQGYFFCRPQIVAGTSIPAFKLHYLNLLRAIAQPDLNISEVEGIIQSEVSLCYKLMRLVNSALFAFTVEIRSVRHALLLLGQQEVKKWGSVVALLSTAQDKPHELTLTSLTRAQCCELLAPALGRTADGPEFFLMGLLSLMDTLLGRPMNEILEQIAPPEETRVALSGGDNRLRTVYELIRSYEQGDWAAVSRHASQLRLRESAFFAAYLDALKWANSVFYGTSDLSAPVAGR
ncbi:MAG TPA: HDOD domain-containing protein [Terriglobia bacterium]